MYLSMGGDALPLAIRTRTCIATHDRYYYVFPALRKIIIALLSLDRTCRRYVTFALSQRTNLADLIGAFDASISTEGA